MPDTLNLQALVERWSHARVGERANTHSYLIELCRALDIEPPRPAGSGYEFEYAVRVVNRDGSETTNFLDLYKRDHFALEAKDYEAGTASDLLLRKAFGQVRSYVGHLPDERPPYLLVLDVGKTLLVWDRWSGDYGGFNAAKRIELAKLPDRPDDASLIRDIFENPAIRDPRSKAIAVTKDIAARLAGLATRLEGQGYEQERVARFLMRCVFTMFAEDTTLVPGEPFRRIIEDVALADPDEFVPLAEELWRAMDDGGRFMLKRLLRFNGHFFREAEALPLDREALAFLLAASRADWKHVEPSIFGTLLTRALDPTERHRLGAEFTPREFVERIVRPTVDEPLRERWTAVQAEVLQLRAKAKKKDLSTAEDRLREFHAWLKGLQFLDPACGSGNFLYVTLNLVKQLEFEVIRALEELTGRHEIRLAEVGPWQFHGIEVKPWAREIAELVLWIGFHQFWAAHHDVQPPEPVLQDTGTLECRDAVLEWRDLQHDPDRDRQDPTPRIRSRVTGELVPDPEARLPYFAHLDAQPAPWPEADFIIGNPPFMGQFRQREEFGDGYVDALRAAYPALPDSADYVMYWWHRAAAAVATGRTLRAGLITTQSITQKQNRQVIAAAAEQGARVTWAIADHYWNDGSEDARVRVAMTVIAKEPSDATLVTVDGEANVTGVMHVARLNADLSAHADVPAAAEVGLRANEGLSSPGFKLHGAGFVVQPEEAVTLLQADSALAAVLKPYRNGKDFTTRPRGVYLIDFGVMSDDDARRYPVLYDIVRDRVRPEREANKREAYAKFWWRFGEARRDLRAALESLPRYIVTPETAKHRLFEFLPADVAADNSLIAIASDDAFHLGVLSSKIHAMWALAAGSRLGIDGTPRYNKGPCFEAFPFPDPHAALRAQIAAVAERIDRHRKDALARDPKVGMTSIYNAIDRLRAGTPLSTSERAVHTSAACGSLREMHDELDRLVAEAYGWPESMTTANALTKLVALHDERAGEEGRGHVRWLRPSYQQSHFAVAELAVAPEMELGLQAHVATKSAMKLVWPAAVLNQIALLRSVLVVEPLTAKQLTKRVKGAREDLVAQQLEILTIMGELRRDDAGRYHVAASLRPAA